jgi:hypothetical protein
MCLVNPQQSKIPRGRKSDWQDCQWLQRLHALGLLHASFHPDADMAVLRAEMRHRAGLIEHRAPHILPMQKALHQMNIQLDRVLSHSTGTTGMAIIRAILEGERDLLTLAQLRNPACKSPEEQFAKAMHGTWRAEHLFACKQSLELYDFYTQQLASCDAEIERFVATLAPQATPPPAPPVDGPLPPAKRGSKSKHKPAETTRDELLRIVGVDLVAVPGINTSLAQTILSEVGLDMTKFPSAKHCGVWLGIVPHSAMSGGKMLRSRTRKVVNRAAQCFGWRRDR